MTFKKGHERYGGRAPGTPNKVTASVREAFAEAFDRMGELEGKTSAEALLEWGRTSKDEFYKLASKLIPVDVSLGIKQIPQARAFPLGPPTITIEQNEQPRLPVASEAMDSI